MNDNDIVEKYYNYRKFPLDSMLSEEERIYIKNRFKDSSDIRESFFRILYSDFTHPTCPYCHDPVKVRGYSTKEKKIYWNTTCGKNSCWNRKLIENTCNTKEKKYGSRGYNNRDKCKETKIKHFGIPNYVNPEKCLITKKERYGVRGYCNPEKSKQTKLERYGDPNYVNPEKCKQTNLKKYGATSWLCSSEGKKFLSRKNSSEEYLEKRRQTIFKRYGVYSITGLQEVQEKINNTKKQHNSFNSSRQENIIFDRLKEKYKIKTQYRDKRYPFLCDLYFEEYDLFVEVNCFWTHGFHPFNPENPEDLKKLEKWKSKNSKFYNTAIQVWTGENPKRSSDVKKREWAKSNRLNFLELWSMDEEENLRIIEEKIVEIDKACTMC